MNAAKTYRLALAEVLRQYPHLSEPDTDPADVESAIQEQICEWGIDAAEHREIYGTAEDSPSIEHCDRWGTGEGRYHGVIG